MTYCVGILLDEGMIFASDSRTHAEVDDFAKFCKMTVFERCGDRVIVLLSSGNLAGTQAVVSVLKQRADAEGAVRNLWNARTMFDVAVLVADAMRYIERRDGQYLAESAINSTPRSYSADNLAASLCGFFGFMRRAILSRRGSTGPICRPVKQNTESLSSIG
jgi:predicted proteasome-type protease